MVLKIRVLKKGLLVDSELFLDERCDINALGAGEDDKAGALLALKDVGEEVTGDPKYFNSMLMKNPYKNWK